MYGFWASVLYGHNYLCNLKVGCFPQINLSNICWDGSREGCGSEEKKNNIHMIRSLNVLFGGSSFFYKLSQLVHINEMIFLFPSYGTN
jgi:hypothetical protein